LGVSPGPFCIPEAFFIAAPNKRLRIQNKSHYLLTQHFALLSAYSSLIPGKWNCSQAGHGFRAASFADSPTVRFLLNKEAKASERSENEHGDYVPPLAHASL